MKSSNLAIASQWPGVSRFTPVFIVFIAVVAISFLTRLALMIFASPGFNWTFQNVTWALVIGFFYDLAMCSFLIIPFILHIWFTGETIYAGRWRLVFIGFYLSLLAVLLFTDLVPADFNEDLRKVIIGFVLARFLIFIFLTFQTTDFRKKWRSTVLYIDFFIVLFLLLFNAISEWFFWDEFSTRYNFIAVDYLVYTTEVIGNIRESYPVTWILILVFILAAGLLFISRPVIRNSVYAKSSFLSRSLISLFLLTIPVCVYYLVKDDWKNFSKNEYANELAGNGIYQFGAAFWNNELDFFKFYQTIPDDEAFNFVRTDLLVPNVKFTTNDKYNIEREITYANPEKHYNIVLISIESLSADFMRSFGSQKSITPYLDSLVEKSIFFTNLYASGTRTVRGLEALALSIPPTPGQSVVKRPKNENLFSIGTILRSKGYITQYIYGGYGYFDNMNYFFTNNGFQVIDRTALKPNEISYQNIWGVADEDLFNLALKVMDSNYAESKPFYAQVMTVSNHRPFTYPDHRIDIPPENQSRDGAVKYTDYAINKFLKEATPKPWFTNTIFVIVADHCAGSAGSVQLPVTGYHIPLLIYAPQILQPMVVNRLMAQIDIPPTILGLLNFRYKSKFFGQDIFNLPPGKERAFISTYQGLGFLKNGHLVIQSPVKKVKEFIPDFISGDAMNTILTDSLVKQAISYYQSASWLIRHKKYTIE